MADLASTFPFLASGERDYLQIEDILLVNECGDFNNIYYEGHALFRDGKPLFEDPSKITFPIFSAILFYQIRRSGKTVPLPYEEIPADVSTMPASHLKEAVDHVREILIKYVQTGQYQPQNPVNGHV